MDVSLIDLLTCPRCGPTYGLILLPAEVRDRRVLSGVLGCANCRERYPVEAGVADLRAGGVAPGRGGGPGEVRPERPDPDVALRLAALLGLTEPGGTVLVAGPATAHAELLSGLVGGLSVVVVAGGGRDPVEILEGEEGEGGEEGGEETSGAAVSLLRAGQALPLRGRSLRGVALTGAWAAFVDEGIRLVGPAGRLMFDPAPEGARERVEAAGLRALVEQGEVLVVGRGE